MRKLLKTFFSRATLCRFYFWRLLPVDILPDVLKPGLKVVFCGTAAGNRSAKIKAYYAGRDNQFWAVLHRIGLTPRQFQSTACPGSQYQENNPDAKYFY